MKTLAAIAAVSAALMIGGGAHAATIIYNTPSGLIYNDNYGHMLGLDFMVNPGYEISVSALGAFDDENDATSRFGRGIIGHLYVGIYDLVADSFAVPLVDFYKTPNPAGTAYVLKSLLAPVILDAGSYSVVSYKFSDQDQNYTDFAHPELVPTLISFNNLGGALTNGGSRLGTALCSSGPQQFPCTLPGIFVSPNQPNKTSTYGSLFGSGTFAADVTHVPVVSAVPEPSTWAMFLVGFGMLGFAMRRRSQDTALAAI